MAEIFMLGAAFGNDRLAASKFSQHFDHLIIKPSLGLECRLSTRIVQDCDGDHWWACVIPSNLSTSGISSHDDAERKTEVGFALYERLKNAPPFLCAEVGPEIPGIDTSPETHAHALCHGFVICEEWWSAQHERIKETYEPFCSGYYWRPWKGELFKRPGFQESDHER